MQAETRTRGTLLAGAVIALAGCTPAPPSPTTLPLDDLRAAVGAATEERRRETSAAFEEALARCMHSQGFEYVPAPSTAETVLPAEDARDFAERWGYGISTATAAPVVAAVPPMSASEEAAYFAALYGDGWVAGDDSDESEGLGGCWEAASAADGASPEDPGTGTELGVELETLEMRISVDSRVADRNRDWSGCMADAGFEVATPADAPQAAITAGQDIEAGASDPAAPQVLAEVQDFERRIAVADLTCQDKVDLVETVRRVRAEYEADFVDQHGPEIEAFIAALNEVGPQTGSSK